MSSSLNESVAIGALVLLLCGAVCFYLYSRLSYAEKKLGMLEAVVVDLKMAMDSLMMEESGEIGLPPIVGGAGGSPVTFSPPIPLEKEDVEEIPEEKFYSSVLEQAHETAPQEEAGPGVSLEAALEGMEAQEAAAAPEPVAQPQQQQQRIGPNYDAMTKAELTALAEQRGLRVKKTLSRGDILNLLRRNEPTEIQPQGAGTENVSGPTGGLFPTASSVDGDYPVDLGQGGGATLEEVGPMEAESL